MIYVYRKISKGKNNFLWEVAKQQYIIYELTFYIYYSKFIEDRLLVLKFMRRES